MSTVSFQNFKHSQSEYPYLHRKDFNHMLIAAAVLHVVVLAAIMLWPRPDVLEIPVRTLDITLGAPQGDTSTELAESLAPLPKVNSPVTPPKAAPPAATTTSAEESFQAAAPKPKPEPAKKVAPAKPRPVVNKAEKRVKIEQKRAPKQQSIPANVPTKVQLPKVYPPVERMQGTSPSVANSANRSLQNNPYQYVRRTRPDAGVQVGQAAGAAQAEQIRARYEQKISAWLQQHRVFPPMARQLGQHGTPILRVRIDRSGQVKFYAIDRSTGYQLIDEAAMDMVRRADPFPAPPADYPSGGLLEFLIPVKFALK